MLKRNRKLLSFLIMVLLQKYAEPFVGGGAVLFDILSKYNLSEIYISDINTELINTYVIIREHIKELLEFLNKYQSEYVPLETENRKSYYISKKRKI